MTERFLCENESDLRKYFDNNDWILTGMVRGERILKKEHYVTQLYFCSENLDEKYVTIGFLAFFNDL